MSFYDRHIVPRVINLAMRNADLLPYRRRMVSRAHGRVLEIGMGSGLNIPFYDSARVSEVIGLEPSTKLIDMAERLAEQSRLGISLVASTAEAMPIDHGSIDTIVMTWTLCSIADPAAALAQMRRVLKPDGQLLFVEHGLAPHEHIRKWQDRLTPIWRRLGGGCHLNRPMRTLIENGGFDIACLDTGYLRRPSAMTFLYQGVAVPGTK